MPSPSPVCCSAFRRLFRLVPPPASCLRADDTGRKLGSPYRRLSLRVREKRCRRAWEVPLPPHSKLGLEKGLLLTWSAVAESEASLRVQDGDTAFASCWTGRLEQRGGQVSDQRSRRVDSDHTEVTLNAFTAFSPKQRAGTRDQVTPADHRPDPCPDHRLSASLSRSSSRSSSTTIRTTIETKMGTDNDQDKDRDEDKM